MQNKIKSLLDKFDALNERERISVVLLTAVAIIIIFTEFVFSPINQKYALAEKQISSLTTKTKQLENQIVILKSKKSS